MAVCGAQTSRGTPCRNRVWRSGQRCWRHGGASSPLGTLPNLLGVVAALISILVGLYIVVRGTSQTPQRVGSAPNPLAVAALAKSPGAPTDITAAMTLVGSSDQAWFISTSGSTTKASFRQAATISLALVAIPSPKLPTRLVSQQVPSGGWACVNVFANAFDVSGPSPICFDPTTANSDAQSWAWTMFPKGVTAGPQTVAISLSVYRGEPLATQTPVSQRTRYMTVDVVRSLLDRYVGLVTGILAALGTVVGLTIKWFLDHIWPPQAELPNGDNSS
jgi:hypothetical protein